MANHKRKRARKPDPKSNRRVRAFRSEMAERGWRRQEIWVPQHMSREEAKVLQDWIEEILTDIRKAPAAESGEA